MTAEWEKLPTGAEISKRAWSSFGAAYRAMTWLYLDFGLAYAILALAVLAVKVLRLDIYSLMDGGKFQWFLSPVELIQFMFIAPVAVASHRFILLREISQVRSAVFLKRSGVYLLWLVAIRFVSEGFNLPMKYLRQSTLHGWSLVGYSGLILATLVMTVFFACRMAMIFPAVAITPGGSPLETIKTSWHQMRGHVWLLIRAVIHAILPIVFAMVLLLLLGWVFETAATTVFVGFAIPGDSGDLLIGIADAFIVVAAAAVDASVVSWLYAWLRKSPGEKSVTP